MNRGLFVWTEVLDYLHLYKKAHGFLRERFCFLAGATKLSRFRSTKEKRKRLTMSTLLHFGKANEFALRSAFAASNMSLCLF